jgi:uncharacterized protein YndB with AHSA1/START domain
LYHLQYLKHKETNKYFIMATNNFEILINASVDNVWNQLTNSIEFGMWMKNVKVETTWQQGDEITYTCYDKDGNVLQWDGMSMIWQGIIKTIEKNKELTCIYPSKSTGLAEESYFLEKIADHKTKLIQVQMLTSQEMADGYKDGTAQTLALLKKHLENISE